MNSRLDLLWSIKLKFNWLITVSNFFFKFNKDKDANIANFVHYGKTLMQCEYIIPTKE